MYEYEGMRRIQYGEERATFVPVCVKCGRFVKADDEIGFDVTIGTWNPIITPKEPNATCKKCGRTSMQGYI
jgi:hypothetical protein